MRPPTSGRDSVQGSVPAFDDAAPRPAGVIRETTTSSTCHNTELRMLHLKPFVAQKRRRRLKLLRSGNKLNSPCTDNARTASFAGILCHRRRNRGRSWGPTRPSGRPAKGCPEPWTEARRAATRWNRYEPLPIILTLTGVRPAFPAGRRALESVHCVPTGTTRSRPTG